MCGSFAQSFGFSDLCRVRLLVLNQFSFIRNGKLHLLWVFADSQYIRSPL